MSFFINCYLHSIKAICMDLSGGTGSFQMPHLWRIPVFPVKETLLAFKHGYFCTLYNINIR